MRKRVLAVLLCVLVAVGLCGCGQDEIYDSDERIAADHDSYSMNVAVRNFPKEGMTGSMDKIVGSLTVWRMNAEAEQEITWNTELQVTSGRAKLCLITPEGKVEKLLEISDKAEITTSDITFTVHPGVNRVKLVCDKDAAGLKINLLCPDGTFVGD